MMQLIIQEIFWKIKNNKVRVRKLDFDKMGKVNDLIVAVLIVIVVFIIFAVFIFLDFYG